MALVDSRSVQAQTDCYGHNPAKIKGAKAMAKGQMRSNKEVKKPKKDKTKPGTAAGSTAAGASMGARFAAAADKGKGDKG